VIPPGVSLPGPFDTAPPKTALAAYLFRVRAMTSVRGRTRTGTLRFLAEPHGLRLSADSPRLTRTPAVIGAFVVSAANEKCVRVYGLVMLHFSIHQ
jgi:hypothetical protein